MNASKFLRLSLSAALLTSVVGMTGCGMNAKSDIRTQNAHNQDARGIRPYSTTDNGRMNGVNGNHKINSMRFSSALSTQVSKLPGVRTAHVVLTDHDAYVAVRLMDDNTSYNTRSMNNNTNRNMGTNTNMSNNMNNMNRNTNSYGLNGASELNNMHGNRSNTIAGDLGNAGRDLGRGIANTGRDVVNDVADTGRNIGNDVADTGRNMGNRMMGRSGMYNTNNTNNTNTTDTNQVPQHLREQISRTIKQSNKVVKNVYVSNDESFMNEVEGYMTNTRGGGGVIGNTMTGFERLVNRIFPLSNEPFDDDNNGVNNMNRSGYNGTNGYNRAR